ncbi:MAG: TonB-dependent receptor plug domain-containing protein [Planctomycetota bacterium]|jgi:outer membrane receptor protein involved in Fe transport
MRRWGIAIALALSLGAGSAGAEGEEGAAPPEGADFPLLPELVVTGERRETTLLDAAQHVSVVTAKEIADRGGETTPDALREEPGVWVQKTAQGGGAPFIRGLTGKQVLVLIDGVRFNNSTFRYGPNQYLNTVDPGMIERIEVVRGPGSVMYGSDALGGVINIITDHGPDPVGAEPAARFTLSEKFSSADLSSATRLQVEGTVGPVGWTVGAGHKHFGDLRAGGNGPSPVGAVDVDGVQPHTGYDESNLNAAMRWLVAPGRELRAAYLFTRQEDVPRSDKMIESTYNLSPSTYIYDPQQAQLAYVEYAARDAGPLETFAANVSYNHQLEGRIKSSYEEDEIGTLGLAASAAFRPVGVQTIGAGVEFYADSISSTGKYPDGSTYDSLGVYVRDEISVSESLSIALGGRYSSYAARADLGGTVVDLTSSTQQTYNDISPTYSDLTWSLEAQYDLGADSSLYLNVARGFRAPNMDDLAADGDWNAGNDIPNPDVQPETAVSYEVGVKHAGARASGGASLFYSDYTDLIERAYYAPGPDDDPDPATSDNVFRMENVGEAEIYGFELWGRAVLRETPSGRWSVSGQLAYARGRDLTDDEPLRRMPPLNGLAGVRWDGQDGRRWAEFFVEAAAEQDDLSPGDIKDTRIPPDGTPGWATVNVRGGVELGRGVSLTAGLHNIGDKRYRVHGSGVDAPGVNLVLGVRWTR